MSNSEPSNETILELKDLKKYYPIHGGLLFKVIANVHAVDGVSLKVNKGETLGLVGESGCGKSTLGKTILRLYEPSSGSISFDGQDFLSLDKDSLRNKRSDIQMVFQDPYESLNSRMTVRQILAEPFQIHNLKTDPIEREKEIKWLLNRVGLPESSLTRYPHEFSGGQRQRIGIARSIALRPKLIVCDEPVSALDVSIQSQILNLLIDLQKELQLTYLFIAHDLSVVKHISDRVAVMYLGEIVELAPAEEIYRSPKHPYTKALISAIPVPDPTVRHKKQILHGDVPSPRNPPSGCRFHTRCPVATDLCKEKAPKLEDYGNGDFQHLAACHYT